MRDAVVVVRRRLGEPWLREIAGAMLSLATNSPVTWQARMRSSIITGVLEASDSSNAFSVQRTMVGRSGRGSISQSEDFSA